MKKTVIHNKLVRDRIPQIITAGGKSCVTRRLSREEYLRCLEEKLSEELSEYLHSGELEELADLLEVMEALVEAKGFTWQELTSLQEAKRTARGGFREWTFLESVTEE